MKQSKSTILLLDSHAVLHRSYHAMPYMATVYGLHSGAVFGFVKAIVQGIRAVNADYVVATFDLGGATFRHLAYQDYKGNRKKTDNELISQIEDAKNFCKAMNIKIVSVEGYEADDCIGSICRKYKEFYNIFILTADMDIMQLIDDENGVKILYLKTLKDEIVFGREQVFEKYNIYPENIIDYKALVGDASDNIKGISGIGDKTAIKIIDNFKNIDNLYNILESQDSEDIVKRNSILTLKIQEKIIMGKEDAYFSKELATIYQDLDIDLNQFLIDDNLWQVMTNKNIAEYKSLCDKYELRSQRGIFDSKNNNDISVNNNNDFEGSIIDDNLQEDIVMQINIDGLDDNTTNYIDNNTNISKENNIDSNIQIKSDIILSDIERQNCIQSIKIYNALINTEKTKGDIEEICNINKIYIKDNLNILDNKNIRTENIKLDNKNIDNDLDLQIDIDNDLGNIKDKDSNFTKDNNIKIKKSKVDHNFKINDNNLIKIKNILEEKVKKENLYDYYLNFEQPSIEVIKQMFINGLSIDIKELSIQQNFVKDKIDILEKQIHLLAGEEFLISSPKQLSVILYDKLNLFANNKKQVKKTGSGDRSTNAEMLERLKNEHEIIPKIIQWRELSKIYNTYLLPLETFIQSDGKIHPEFNQIGAATGRWSCENPNLQNLPANSEIGKRVRNIFVASKGYKIVSLDYSQIDLRSAAILSGDEKLIDIFNKDLDIHTAVAAKILNKKLEDIDKDERSSAKAINFGILYGMGVSSLAQSIGGDRKKAQEFYDNYKKTFHTLMSYLDNVKTVAKSVGFTETLFGRKRDVYMLFSPIPFIRAQGERIAINAPIQGTSADIIKKGAIDIMQNLHKEIIDQDIKFLLQIHDELVFEIKDNQCLETNISKIKNILENVINNNLDLAKNLKDNNGNIKRENIIPLKVSIHSGNNLGEVK